MLYGSTSPYRRVNYPGQDLKKHNLSHRVFQHNIITQIRAERNAFGLLMLLSVQHDIDLKLTWSFLLGRVPYIESPIEPTTSHSTEGASYVVNGNA